MKGWSPEKFMDVFDEKVTDVDDFLQHVIEARTPS